MVEIKLRWRVKTTKKNGKTYPLYYISVPGRSAVFLINYEPVLDPESKVIVFKPKQNQSQQPQSQ